MDACFVAADSLIVVLVLMLLRFNKIAVTDCPEVLVTVSMSSLPWLEYVLRVTGGSREKVR